MDDVLLVATREVAVGEAITYDREAIMRRDTHVRDESGRSPISPIGRKGPARHRGDTGRGKSRERENQMMRLGESPDATLVTVDVTAGVRVQNARDRSLEQRTVQAFIIESVVRWIHGWLWPRSEPGGGGP